MNECKPLVVGDPPPHELRWFGDEERAAGAQLLGRGLHLSAISAQPEPCLKLKNTVSTPACPLTPRNTPQTASQRTPLSHGKRLS